GRTAEEEATDKMAAGLVLYPMCWALEGWLVWRLAGLALFLTFLLAVIPSGVLALAWRERLGDVGRQARAFVWLLTDRDLARRLRLRLAALGVFVWSAATVASGLAPTYALLLVARAVIGAGEASYSVVTPSLLSDCYPAERRARALGIFYAAIPVGSALGYI